jgi:hypothetical protein
VAGALARRRRFCHDQPMDTPLRARFESALAVSSSHGPLVALALALIDEGQTQQQVYQAFDEMRESLRREGRDFDESSIMDVMDRIVGYCPPELRLFEPGQ